MTIDEAIAHCLEVAEQEECFINYPHSDIVRDDLNIESRKRYATEQRQLAEWLTDYKELKNSIDAIKLSNMTEALETDTGIQGRKHCTEEMIAEYKQLLKMAVEDFKEINSSILTCKYCKWYSEDTDDCTYLRGDVPCEKICGWKHEGEVLKLIGETNDES